MKKEASVSPRKLWIRWAELRYTSWRMSSTSSRVWSRGSSRKRIPRARRSRWREKSTARASLSSRFRRAKSSWISPWASSITPTMINHKRGGSGGGYGKSGGKRRRAHLPFPARNHKNLCRRQAPPCVLHPGYEGGKDRWGRLGSTPRGARGGREDAAPGTTHGAGKDPYVNEVGLDEDVGSIDPRRDELHPPGPGARRWRRCQEGRGPRRRERSRPRPARWRPGRRAPELRS